MACLMPTPHSQQERSGKWEALPRRTTQQQVRYVARIIRVVRRHLPNSHRAWFIAGSIVMAYERWETKAFRSFEGQLKNRQRASCLI